MISWAVLKIKQRKSIWFITWNTVNQRMRAHLFHSKLFLSKWKLLFQRRKIRNYDNIFTFLFAKLIVCSNKSTTLKLTTVSSILIAAEKIKFYNQKYSRYHENYCVNNVCFHLNNLLTMWVRGLFRCLLYTEQKLHRTDNVSIELTQLTKLLTVQMLTTDLTLKLTLGR